DRAAYPALADAVVRPCTPPPHARCPTALLRIHRELSACGRVPPALPVAGDPPGTRRGSRMGLRRGPGPRHLRASERDVSRSFLCRPGRARETAAPAEAPVARAPHRVPRPPALRAGVPARAVAGAPSCRDERDAGGIRRSHHPPPVWPLLVRAPVGRR